MRKIISLFLILVLTACLFAGCSDTANQIASSVAQAARDELEAQVKKVLEENKLEVIEVKTAFGKLNNTAEAQLFVAALVRTEKTDIIEASLSGLNKLFTATGCMKPTAPSTAICWFTKTCPTAAPTSPTALTTPSMLTTTI